MVGDVEKTHKSRLKDTLFLNIVIHIFIIQDDEDAAVEEPALHCAASSNSSTCGRPNAAINVSRFSVEVHVFSYDFCF